MAGPSNFDVESFKQEIFKEFSDEMRQMIKDMVAKMVGKMPFGKENSEIRTILGKPLKKKHQHIQLSQNGSIVDCTEKPRAQS